MKVTDDDVNKDKDSEEDEDEEGAGGLIYTDVFGNEYLKQMRLDQMMLFCLAISWNSYREVALQGGTTVAITDIKQEMEAKEVLEKQAETEAE